MLSYNNAAFTAPEYRIVDPQTKNANITMTDVNTYANSVQQKIDTINSYDYLNAGGMSFQGNSKIKFDSSSRNTSSVNMFANQSTQNGTITGKVDIVGNILVNGIPYDPNTIEQRISTMEENKSSYVPLNRYSIALETKDNNVHTHLVDGTDRYASISDVNTFKDNYDAFKTRDDRKFANGVLLGEDKFANNNGKVFDSLSLEKYVWPSEDKELAEVIKPGEINKENLTLSNFEWDEMNGQISSSAIDWTTDTTTVDISPSSDIASGSISDVVGTFTLNGRTYGNNSVPHRNVKGINNVKVTLDGSMGQVNLSVDKLTLAGGASTIEVKKMNTGYAYVKDNSTDSTKQICNTADTDECKHTIYIGNYTVPGTEKSVSIDLNGDITSTTLTKV
jgi:hypothetical protein